MVVVPLVARLVSFRRADGKPQSTESALCEVGHPHEKEPEEKERGFPLLGEGLCDDFGEHAPKKVNLKLMLD